MTLVFSHCMAYKSGGVQLPPPVLRTYERLEGEEILVIERWETRHHAGSGYIAWCGSRNPSQRSNAPYGMEPLVAVIGAEGS